METAKMIQATVAQHLTRFRLHRLCLSITDFHPDTWNPAWSVSTILTGLLSFMVEKGPTLGSIETSDYTVSTERDLRLSSCWCLKYLTPTFFPCFSRKDSCRRKAWPLTSRIRCSVSCFLTWSMYVSLNLWDRRRPVLAALCWTNLFSPVLHQEMKQKQKAQEELRARTQPLPLPDVVPDGDPQQAHYGLPAVNGAPVPLPGANPAPGLQQANRNHGLLGGALANLFVIVGFAAFAYTVKYVLRSIAQE